MGSTLNFNTLKKQVMPVILNDEAQTKLLISMPTKKVMDKFINLRNITRDSENQEDNMSELYSLCAEIMSQNKGRIKVTKGQLEEILDFEDIMIFIESYTAFIRGITSQKN